MKNHPVAMAVLCLLFGCSGNGSIKSVRPLVIEDIGRCGGGLKLSSNIGLSVAISNELEGAAGKLSLSVEKRLEAAFIEKLGRDRDDALQIFRLYVDCIAGADSIANTIRVIDLRAVALRTQLSAQGVAEEDIIAIEDLKDREKAALDRREFLAARDIRNTITARIVSVVVAHGGDPAGIDYSLSDRNPITLQQAKKTRAEKRDRFRVAAVSACYAYSPTDNCKKIGTEAVAKQLIGESLHPCNNIFTPEDNHRCIEALQKPEHERPE